MKLERLFGGQLKPFTLAELAAQTGLPLPSARVLASRKVRAGGLTRVRRDLYLLADAFQDYEEKDFFLLANMIQTPSYVSFTTALSYYNLTTQIQTSIVESANPVRSCSYQATLTFRYIYCSQKYYFGFRREDGFFVAEPEKGLLDCLYLISLGRYSLDRSALDLKGIRWGLFDRFVKKYPKRVQKFCKDWRRDYEDTRAA